MSRLNVAVAGVGGMGKRHAENLCCLVPQARLVAIADADAQHASKVATELEIDRFYTRFEDLLAHKDLDAVVIASPGKFHASSVRLAAEAGKAILCEKPLGLNLPEIDEALVAVRRRGVPLQVGHMRRYDPAYAEARRRIEAGEIGDPVIFKSIGRDKEPPPPEYFKAGLNGMLFLDSSIHDFDLARWLMSDEVAEVQSFITTMVTPYLSEFGDIDAGVVNLRFDRGAIGNVESFRQAMYGYDIRSEVIGTKGTIMIGSLQQTAAMVLTTAGVMHGAVSHWLERFSEAYLREMRDFVATVLAGREPKVTGDDGRKAVAIGLAAERSFREKRPIAMAEMTEQMAAKRTPA